ncbi:hypothetical protein [Algoriphagus pacificus]|uniref:Outer membrane protein beta-barrel domain-containing protein n=1 Tax=Algoriphagus pacificus TaxID=2811234 RepID=A0ABS3CDE8_9BACT|nr:hypothetical protein [Algoriphagus pacificus]MBN7814830.1 hypothetical protein [Algoriphagus pacificus]
MINHESIAQKRDYIVIQSKAYTQGIIRDLPSEENTVVYFKIRSREGFKRYSIDEVDELMFNQRKFFRKTVQSNGITKTVYLELLPQEFDKIKLWQLNQEKDEFFIETEDKLIHLDESYPIVLEEIIDNSDLKPLIAITGLNWYDLTYFFNTAARHEETRTYTPMLVFTPFVGITFLKNQFNIPNSLQAATLSGSGANIGFNGELFLNFKRNISLNLGPSWSSFGLKTLTNYTNGPYFFESDIYMEFSTIQLPITGKFYLDIKPNRTRAFLEAGYVFSFTDFKKTGMYVAQQEGASITTYHQDLLLESHSNGFTFGVGLEKYFEKSNGIAAGIRRTHLDSGDSQKIISFSLFTGFKF